MDKSAEEIARDLCYKNGCPKCWERPESICNFALKIAAALTAHGKQVEADVQRKGLWDRVSGLREAANTARALGGMNMPEYDDFDWFESCDRLALSIDSLADAISPKK